MKRTIAELSIDSKEIYGRLITTEENGFVAYSELNNLIGRDVQNDARGNLNTARNMAQRENNMIFEAVVGQGLKRLDDAGKVNTAIDTLTGIKRAARRGAKKLFCVDNFDSLPNDAKIKHNTYASVLGVISHMSKEKSVKTIEHMVVESKKELPIGKTLELFR